MYIVFYLESESPDDEPEFHHYPQAIAEALSLSHDNRPYGVWSRKELKVVAIAYKQQVFTP